MIDYILSKVNYITSKIMHTILVVEPNTAIERPYSLVPKGYHIIRTSSTDKGVSLSQRQYLPDVIMLSSNVPEDDALAFMSTMLETFETKIIPLIYVVDLSRRVNIVPGTYWAQKMGVLCSLSSKKEVFATMERVLGHEIEELRNHKNKLVPTVDNVDWK